MQNELSKYTVQELNQILKSVNEMITIPIVNKWNLKREQLIEMKEQLKTELKTR
jgi:hypothetical protein|tara:strand:+ start:46 stop:207 length:162 start_codon:yes stop_codon:yes gene_type:complete